MNRPCKKCERLGDNAGVWVFLIHTDEEGVVMQSLSRHALPEESGLCDACFIEYTTAKLRAKMEEDYTNPHSHKPIIEEDTITNTKLPDWFKRVPH